MSLVDCRREHFSGRICGHLFDSIASCQLNKMQSSEVVSLLHHIYLTLIGEFRGPRYRTPSLGRERY